MWLWAAILCVFVVLFTSSIFIFRFIRCKHDSWEEISCKFLTWQPLKLKSGQVTKPRTLGEVTKTISFFVYPLLWCLLYDFSSPTNSLPDYFWSWCLVLNWSWLARSPRVPHPSQSRTQTTMQLKSSTFGENYIWLALQHRCASWVGGEGVAAEIVWFFGQNANVRATTRREKITK